MKKILVVLSVLVVLFIVAELTAPFIVARGLEMGLNRTLGSDVSVGLQSYPSLRLLLGQFDALSVVARNVSLGGLRASEYRVAAEKVNINLRHLLAQKELEFIDKGDMTVSITIAEAELTRYLWEQVPELKDWRVLINEDDVIVSGQAPLLNALFEVRITGKFAVLSEDKLSFVTESVRVQGTSLPRELVDAAFAGTEFHLDLAAAPMPLELIEGHQAPGLLTIRARVLE